MFACFLLRQLFLGRDSHYMAVIYVYMSDCGKKNYDELSYVRMKRISLQL